MTELSNWENIRVPQRHYTGCVPTGYEWLIRYLGVPGVNLETFQEDFDLDLNQKTLPQNNFQSVGSKITARYPHINIQIKSYDQGLEKIQAIRSLIEKQSPCLVSIALGGSAGCHIMPVVYIDNNIIKMIHDAKEGENHVWGLPIEDVIQIHNYGRDGKDIAWIKV
jgi:hypothetical protein